MKVMTRAEFRVAAANRMSEDDLQIQVIAIAHQLGFLAYHTHDSRKSEKGFPDLVLVHGARGRLLFRELKKQSGQLSEDQRRWLAALHGAADVGVWRPIDLLEGRVLAELRAPQPTTTTHPGGSR
ncbi:VRR-NUC domain-containing protein [Cellulosimicrobium funkei]|uniref:VRR-NUC domain-containing protein n=1 Tax=Cellulosimicrobium funkei TaxID=264251 RepID=UPI00365B0BB4